MRDMALPVGYVEYGLADPRIGLVKATTANWGLAPTSAIADGLGRVVQTERDISGNIETVRAEYTHGGQISAYVLQEATELEVWHRFQYDTFGQLRYGVDPDMGPRWSAWDAHGRVVHTTNGELDQVKYGYDAIGRLKSRATFSATTPELNESFSIYYDGYSELTSACDTSNAAHASGRLTMVSREGEGVVSCMEYDAEGKTSRTVQSILGEQVSQTHIYSPSGIIKESRIYRNAADIDEGGVSTPMIATKNRYNRAGALIAIMAKVDSQEADPYTDVWTRVDYDATGTTLKERFGNGVTQQYEVNVLKRVTRLSIAPPGLDGTDHLDIAVTHNAYGSITEVTDLLHGPSTSSRPGMDNRVK